MHDISNSDLEAETGQPQRADYLGVHQRNYARIAAGEQEGWSTPQIVAGMLAAIKRALALPGAPVSGRLLELGCGDACLSVVLAQELPFTVSGIDIVPLAIELAQKRAERAGVALELRTGSVAALPWPDGAFDVLIDAHCLHCIVLDDRQRFFAEAKRVLRPGGMLVLLTMVGDPPPEMRAYFDAATRNVVHGGVAGRHFGTPESILAEAAQAGFCVIEHLVSPAREADAADELVAALIR
jgi:2-polyprenyl-3-methyl-5-hydroxy-6-metoxy-1,4-benzoquinol methylase